MTEKPEEQARTAPPNLNIIVPHISAPCPACGALAGVPCRDACRFEDKRTPE